MSGSEEEMSAIKHKYGRLADDSLRRLTLLEEFLADLEHGNPLMKSDLREAQDALSEVQEYQNTILAKYEEEEGPL
jgi:hypothetical protein